MTIVNDDSRVVNKLEASLTDDARVVIYDRHKPLKKQETMSNKTAVTAKIGKLK